MLPEALLCLLSAAIAYAQTRQELKLNEVTSFTPLNVPNPPVFTLPASETLFISVTLCSEDPPPRFFVSNDSTTKASTQDTGPNTFEIQIDNGFGNWTGAFMDGGTLAVENLSSMTFEIGVSNNQTIHEILPDLPFFGDSTSNQALLFSPVFAIPTAEKPRYPNYTLPSANLSQPQKPFSSPNYTLIVAPTTSSTPLTALAQTACRLTSRNSTGKVVNDTVWLRNEGWRHQWLLEGLTPSTNYTVYVVQDSTKVSGPIYFATKSASFACPLVTSLPYCPNVAYTVPLPPPPNAGGSNVYDASTLPNSVTNPLLEILSNFTVVLTTFACGRDWYSPLVGCDDCQREYRRWLCTRSFTRCGEPNPSNPDSYTVSPAPPTATGFSAAMSPDGQHAQKVLSALVPQSTDRTIARNPDLPSMTSEYLMLLPCLERCSAVDRACPPFLGFGCPNVQFNAAASYGVGYIDSVDNNQGKGVTGTAQDRWGNVWCNYG